MSGRPMEELPPLETYVAPAAMLRTALMTTTPGSALLRSLAPVLSWAPPGQGPDLGVTKGRGRRG